MAATFEWQPISLWEEFFNKKSYAKVRSKNGQNYKFNFDPPAIEDEIMAASLQFVRKLSGINVPSKTNEEAYNRAIKEVALVARNLLDSLVTNAEPRNRENEIQRARSRAAKRFGTNDD